MQNPYELLGISKNATPSEIKKAYHKLARAYHPDVNPDKQAAEKFKTITAAYELLSDLDKKKRFDNGEIDANGNPTPFGFGAYDNQGFGGFKGSHSYQGFNPDDLASMFKGGGGFDFSDLFGGFSNSFKNQHYSTQPESTPDTTYNLTIPFDLSITGGETTVTLDTKKLKIKIPAGVTNDSTLRLKGQGKPNYKGKNSDALIKINIQNSNLYTREGDNITLTLPISLKEAILGSKITIPTPYGEIMIKIPPYSSSGKIMRIKGKGVKDKGDILVRLNVVLPAKENKELTDFIQNWNEPIQTIRPF